MVPQLRYQVTVSRRLVQGCCAVLATSFLVSRRRVIKNDVRYLNGSMQSTFCLHGDFW